ncbi:hypothetical protein M3484_01210 [Pseudomonas sp. GX19020]|uniref:hypothetical protein n=1 Tax=Pseudomonas sp. GX19020 TaxID=2942277 RepID=UPI0020195F16|nr:hypothetical protein [Pseudomonas sp. GX19020]MCL4065194.1 hypothetical protein [Pseudomonas sp. GX19020]
MSRTIALLRNHARAWTKAAALAVAAFSVTPDRAEAVMIYFYSENHCRGKVRLTTQFRAVNGIRGHGLGNLNDEFRSVKFVTDYPEKADIAGGYLAVYDDPEGRPSVDDEAHIWIKDIRLFPPGGFCVGTFENNLNGAVKVEYRRKNGLDGKVSYFVMECRDSCRESVDPPTENNGAPPRKELKLRDWPRFEDRVFKGGNFPKP